MESDRKIAPSFPLAPPSNGVSSAFPRARPMHGRTTGPTRRSTKGQWTPEEDEILRKAVQRYKGKNWKKIAECFKDRTDVQCLHRWQKVLNPELIKGPWSKEEDEIIVQLVNKYGPKKWSTIAQHLPGRIGKQCRERWHNHLNPAINKEAWTQEEELVLIRAHQIHGNRWAELTKYLPGRTDNAIKNHWNSSVKKKLDSYIASGLLAQLQGLPLVTYQSSMAAAPLHGVCKDGNPAELAEDNSESSQVGCSQTASDMSYTMACQTTPREDSLLPDESDYGKMNRTTESSPAGSCSVPYSTSLDDITFTIPDIPYEFTCPSMYLEENFSKDCSNFGAITLPSVSCMELASDSSNPGHVFSYQSTGYDNNCGSVLGGNDLVMAPVVQKQKPRKACSRVTFPSEEGGDSCAENLSNVIDMDRYREALNFESVFPLSGAGGTIALQSSCNPLDTNRGERSDCQNLPSVPFEDSGGHNLVTCTKDLNQIQLNADSAEQTDLKEPSRLVPVNTFTSETSDGKKTAEPSVGQETVECTSDQAGPSVAQQTAECTSEQDRGSLCYEPPRFPSLDIPFFSCDLAQSGPDTLQDYSPLGIRQLMMSSMNSLTPFKLWDSPPSSDDNKSSPDAVLKSAAKTFACTPSILKKRHRDLLSPLSPFSERRYDKKTGSDVVKQGFLCTSRLTKEFSRLDVMFDEAAQRERAPSPSDEEKENICLPSSQGQTADVKHDLDDGDKMSQEELKKNDAEDKNNEGILEHGNMPRGVLIERPLNNMEFSSPDGAGPKPTQKSSDQSSNDTSKKGPTTDKAKQNNDPISGPSVSAAASTEMMVDSLISEVGAENLNIFGGTPFRRSIESPSAWKSPWYFSSLVTCPRFDQDITIEDIGIFMSPGIRSVDALGLMKQINEQSADAYAEAREVLGNETPESIMKQRTIRPEKLDLAECRVLDFSECGTPTKAAAEGLSSPQPAACLVKSYR